MLMKRSLAFLFGVCFILCISLPAFSLPLEKSFTKTDEGVLIYPVYNLSGNTSVVRIQVLTDKIIRVTSSPDSIIPAKKSLIAENNTLSKNWTVVKQAERVLVKTPVLTASVSLSTGAVSFVDKNGTPVVMERQNNGREFRPAVFEGQPSYNITQTFETTADDAYYGLGQHQDDQFNYKGRQVFLFQNNTEVAVPFLISKKNYGILWDNYSLTKIWRCKRLYASLNLKAVFERRRLWLADCLIQQRS